ncbi:protein MGARP [Bufo gargarizans]|uniref:protein MGARP n=1 Tax=Bufo gargarizans TaxID=30331 RepID=UPI001CF23023|nr:protein MGARP [Bufo gargarizans]
MLLCRNVWQKLAPLTHRGAAAALLRNASVRPMSSSSVPGSSGEALPYYLLVAVALTGGGFYAYRTLRRDKARFHERHEYINEQLKPAFEEYETKSDKVEASAVSETIEEAVEAAIEETAAEEVTEQEAAPSATLEQEQAVAEDEAAPAPTEDGAAPAPTEQESAPSTEAASEQVEPENIEPVVENVEETSPVLEASSDNITEELASAAEDWSELTARKPEETVEESAPAAQESEEAVGSEQATTSS